MSGTAESPLSSRGPLAAGAVTGRNRYSNLNKAFQPAANRGKAVLGLGPRTGPHVLGASRPRLQSSLVQAPKPVDLPSLRRENSGLDPSINIVPSGGTGWVSSKAKDNNENPLPNGEGPCDTAASSPQQVKPVRHWEVAVTAAIHPVAISPDFPTAAEAMRLVKSDKRDSRVSFTSDHGTPRNLDAMSTNTSATDNTKPIEVVHETTKSDLVGSEDTTVNDGPTKTAEKSSTEEEHSWLEDDGDMDYSKVPIFHTGVDGVEVVTETTSQEVIAPVSIDTNPGTMVNLHDTDESNCKAHTSRADSKRDHELLYNHRHAEPYDSTGDVKRDYRLHFSGSRSPQVLRRQPTEERDSNGNTYDMRSSHARGGLSAPRRDYQPLDQDASYRRQRPGWDPKLREERPWESKRNSERIPAATSWRRPRPVPDTVDAQTTPKSILRKEPRPAHDASIKDRPQENDTPSESARPSENAEGDAAPQHSPSNMAEVKATTTTSVMPAVDMSLTAASKSANDDLQNLMTEVSRLISGMDLQNERASISEDAPPRQADLNDVSAERRVPTTTHPKRKSSTENTRSIGPVQTAHHDDDHALFRAVNTPTGVTKKPSVVFKQVPAGIDLKNTKVDFFAATESAAPPSEVNIPRTPAEYAAQLFASNKTFPLQRSTSAPHLFSWAADNPGMPHGGIPTFVYPITHPYVNQPLLYNAPAHSGWMLPASVSPFHQLAHPGHPGGERHVAYGIPANQSLPPYGHPTLQPQQQLLSRRHEEKSAVAKPIGHGRVAVPASQNGAQEGHKLDGRPSVRDSINAGFNEKVAPAMVPADVLPKHDDQNAVREDVNVLGRSGPRKSQEDAAISVPAGSALQPSISDTSVISAAQAAATSAISTVPATPASSESASDSSPSMILPTSPGGDKENTLNRARSVDQPMMAKGKPVNPHSVTNNVGAGVWRSPSQPMRKPSFERAYGRGSQRPAAQSNTGSARTLPSHEMRRTAPIGRPPAVSSQRVPNRWSSDRRTPAKLAVPVKPEQKKATEEALAAAAARSMAEHQAAAAANPRAARWAKWAETNYNAARDGPGFTARLAQMHSGITPPAKRTAVTGGGPRVEPKTVNASNLSTDLRTPQANVSTRTALGSTKPPEAVTPIAASEGDRKAPQSHASVPSPSSVGVTSSARPQMESELTRPDTAPSTAIGAQSTTSLATRSVQRSDQAIPQPEHEVAMKRTQTTLPTSTEATSDRKVTGNIAKAQAGSCTVDLRCIPPQARSPIIASTSATSNSSIKGSATVASDDATPSSRPYKGAAPHANVRPLGSPSAKFTRPKGYGSKPRINSDTGDTEITHMSLTSGVRVQIARTRSSSSVATSETTPPVVTSGTSTVGAASQIADDATSKDSVTVPTKTHQKRKPKARAWRPSLSEMAPTGIVFPSADMDPTTVVPAVDDQPSVNKRQRRASVEEGRPSATMEGVEASGKPVRGGRRGRGRGGRGRGRPHVPHQASPA
ncbi:hypothetical protein HDU85_004873 [Gaertneriomyces sp. JEL0708]|nr:hypothetical protein HDU85_004873 [Gaertneriomyces sp. JEL0708]